MTRTADSGASFEEELRSWAASLPMQFLAFHGMCRGALERIARERTAGEGSIPGVEEQQKLRTLFHALEELSDAIQAARESIGRLRAAAAPIPGDPGQALARWTKAQLDSLASLGRTITQAEQTVSAIRQARETGSEADARVKALAPSNLPAPSAPNPGPQPPSVSPSPPAPQPVPLPLDQNLEQACDEVTVVLSQCEPFARIFRQHESDLVPLRRGVNDLLVTPPSSAAVQDLSRSLQKLLDTYRADAQKDRQLNLATMDRLLRWSNRISGSPYPDMPRVEEVRHARVETANDLIRFRKQASLLAGDILTFVSGEPAALVEALVASIDACNGKFTVLKGIPRTKQLMEGGEHLRSDIPRRELAAPDAMETLRMLEECAQIETALDALIVQANREWEDVRTKMAGLQTRNNEAISFAVRTFTAEEDAWQSCAVAAADPDVSLDDTVAALEQARRQVDGFVRRTVAALDARCAARRRQAEQLQIRLRGKQAVLPQPPGRAEAWAEWDRTLAAWDVVCAELNSCYRQAAAECQRQIGPTNDRLQRIATGALVCAEVDQRKASDLIRRISALPPLEEIPPFDAFDQVFGELDIAESFLMRIEGLEQGVHSATENLDRRLSGLLDGGLAERRPSLAGRAGALLEGLRQAAERPGGNWRQLARHAEVLAGMLDLLETDQGRLAAAEMEMLAGKLCQLCDRQPPGRRKEQLEALLNDVERLDDSLAPPPLLRRRVLAALEASGETRR